MQPLMPGWPLGSWLPQSLDLYPEADALIIAETPECDDPSFLHHSTGVYPNRGLGDACVLAATREVPQRGATNELWKEGYSPRQLAYFGVSGTQSLSERRATSNTFADDHFLETPELDMLRAFISIASRLHCTDRVWSLSSTSVFIEPPPDLQLENIPQNLLPTRAQRTISHYPAIDTLPWPGVRDRLLAVWSIPEAHWLRHPTDGEPCNMLKFWQDGESGSIKIWGPDPAAIDAWEVQEPFFSVWWWALDQISIAASNRRRLAR